MADGEFATRGSTEDDSVHHQDEDDVDDNDLNNNAHAPPSSAEQGHRDPFSVDSADPNGHASWQGIENDLLEGEDILAHHHLHGGDGENEGEEEEEEEEMSDEMQGEHHPSDDAHSLAEQQTVERAVSDDHDDDNLIFGALEGAKKKEENQDAFKTSLQDSPDQHHVLESTEQRSSPTRFIKGGDDEAGIHSKHSSDDELFSSPVNRVSSQVDSPLSDPFNDSSDVRDQSQEFSTLDREENEASSSDYDAIGDYSASLQVQNHLVDSATDEEDDGFVPPPPPDPEDGWSDDSSQTSENSDEEEDESDETLQIAKDDALFEGDFFFFCSAFVNLATFALTCSLFFF